MNQPLIEVLPEVLVIAQSVSAIEERVLLTVPEIEIQATAAQALLALRVDVVPEVSATI
jgi:hypothetical protein